MSDKQLLLLLFYMTLSAWLEYKSATSRNQDAQVGWGAANWIVLCLYTSQFATLINTMDSLKDLPDWMVLLLGFFMLVLYCKFIQIILSEL